MVNRDFAALAKLYQELGFIPADEDITPVVQALNNALPDVLNASVTELNIKSVVERLGDVFYMYPFSLPPFYVAIIRCLGVLEGVALQVDGSFAIIQDAYPYIASRLLTDPSPRLQAALYSLIFRNGELQWNYLEGLLEKASKSSDSDMNALVSAVEQLADYLLSPEGEPALNSLKLQLVEELDELGAPLLGMLVDHEHAAAHEGLLDVTRRHIRVDQGQPVDCTSHRAQRQTACA